MSPIMPHDIQEWYETAARYDTNWRTMVAEQKLYSSGSGSTRPGQSTGQCSAASGSSLTPNRGTTGSSGTQTRGAGSVSPRYTAPPPRSSNLPPGVPMDTSIDRAERRPINCYNCGRPGHMARDCRSRDTGNRVRTAQGVRVMTLNEMRDYFSQNTTNPVTEQENAAAPGAQQDFQGGEQ